MPNICRVSEYSEYESFASSHEKGHFLQSERWARLKSNWGRVFLLAKDSDGKTIGAVSALLRPLPGIRRSLMVCARGPVCDPGDEETYEALLRALIAEAKSRRCYCLRFEPELLSDDEKVRKLLPALGFLKMDGASGDRHRTVKASALLHDRAIGDAIQRGDRLYDFRGVSGYGDEKSPAYGIYRFKKGFGGDLVALAGAYELVFNRKVNDLTKLGQSLLKKWRRVKV